MLTKTALSLVTLFLVAPLWAQANCLNKLSSGNNSLRVAVPRAPLAELLRGVDRHSSSIRNRNIALLIDYSQNSRQKRSYLIDLRRCDLISHDHVVHGGAEPRQWPAAYVERDGQLLTCRNRNGTRQYMTRPGFAVTAGCHQSNMNWPVLSGSCKGVKLRGLERRNDDLMSRGVVMHEHVAVVPNGQALPAGQGCPTYAPGALRSMVRHGIMDGALVYIHAPQCR